MFQVRTIVTETAFSIDELEELYVLFKVSYSLHIHVVGPCKKSHRSLFVYLQLTCRPNHQRCSCFPLATREDLI